CTT
ncbi:hypothetical protein CISIN_1g0041162mg, partial [Citrus sinensis]